MMLLDFDLWSFILIIGIGQGALLCLILLFKKPSHTSLVLLGILLAILTANLVEFLLLSSEYYVFVPHLIQVTNPFLFLIGPLFYFFVKSHLEPNFRVSPLQFVHFIPFLLAFAYYIPWYLELAEVKLRIFEESLSGKVYGIDFRGFFYAFAHITITLTYIINSCSKLKKSGSDRRLRFLHQFSKVFIGYWAIQFIGLVGITMLQYYVLTIDFILALINSVFIQILSIHLLSQLNFLADLSCKIKYQGSSLSPEAHKNLLVQIQDLLMSKELYLDGQLTLQTFSGELAVNKNYVSQVINKEFHCGFNDYINKFRVEKAKLLMMSSKYDRLKLLAIALESGFNNKTSFNRVFTRVTGQTPSEYRKQITTEKRKPAIANVK